MKVEKMVTDDVVDGEQSEEDDVFLTPDSVVGSGPEETPSENLRGGGDGHRQNADYRRTEDLRAESPLQALDSLRVCAGAPLRLSHRP